jgi:dihydrofolate reductase
MRTLVVGTFVTLDGVMPAPGGPNEDRDGGFQHGGWLVPYLDEMFGEIMTKWTKRADAFLLGRKTYEMFAASWPNSTNPEEALNIRPKFVVSRTLDRVDWNNSMLSLWTSTCKSPAHVVQCPTRQELIIKYIPGCDCDADAPS